MGRKNVLLCRWVLVASLAIIGTATVALTAPAPQQAPSAKTKAIGTVQSVANGAVTIKTDAGAEIRISTQPSTRVLRISTGQTSLKQATPIQLNDIQPGDRVLAVGPEGGNPNVMTASSVIVMKRSDVVQKQQQEELQWEKSSVGGLVRTVDPATKTITIKSRVKGAPATITIHTSPQTVLRRYAPGSVRFQDARPAPFDQIKPGDQLRARGAISADGKSVNAEAIISGTFRNVAGRITDVDAETGEITVKDLLSKQSVDVKVTPQSEIRKLPEEVADRIATEVKGVGAQENSAGAASTSSSGAQKSQTEREPGANPHPQGTPGRVDIDQVLKNLPPAQLNDLKKGDAVMIVSTEGVDQTVTAIKLVSGVDPILSAPPGKNRAAALRSLWSGFTTGGGGGGGGSSSSSSGSSSGSSGSETQ